jgi:hypothetical protein
MSAQLIVRCWQILIMLFWVMLAEDHNVDFHHCENLKSRRKKLTTRHNQSRTQSVQQLVTQYTVADYEWKLCLLSFFVLHCDGVSIIKCINVVSVCEYSCQTCYCSWLSLWECVEGERWHETTCLELLLWTDFSWLAAILCLILDPVAILCLGRGLLLIM